jgi:Kdo2-lipid IVA lauroyltransferase/acyltransferase
MKWYYPVLASPIYLFLLLPLKVLYLFSDFVFVILYYVSGYRKKVVFQNLRSSFPSKSEEEIKAIAVGYYRHMVDVIFETMKLATMSKGAIAKRVKFNNMELIENMRASGQSFIFVLGHMGNWEWTGPSFSQQNQTKLYALYHPLSNAFFDWFIYRMRVRFDGALIPMNNLLREMAKLKNEYCAIAFIADQTPMPENAYWVNFLNQDTPVFFGTEKIAKRFNYPVVYVSAKKLKRGYYECTFKLLSDNPAATPDGYITELHTALLEQDILSMPHIWLWSHRRWKHKRKI